MLIVPIKCGVFYTIIPTQPKSNSEKRNKDINNINNKNEKNRSRSMNKPPKFSIDENRSISIFEKPTRRSSPSPSRKFCYPNKKNQRGRLCIKQKQ